MRTEGDTWDIVSSVGMTALQVAAARAVETQRPDAMIHDAYAAEFVRAAGDPDTQRLIDDPTLWADTPFMNGFIGVRSKFFDDLFLSAGRDGVRQAVILAAGLDVRAYRLDWPAGTVVFEIDQPKVLEFKRQVLDKAGATPRADRREVAIDLREDWPAALIAAGFDPSLPTAWSAEGLLPYLPGDAQDALFAQIDRLSPAGSSLAADTLDDGMDLAEIEQFQAEHRDSSFGKLDLASLFYTDKRADTADWLTAQGWAATKVSPDELAAQYGRPGVTVSQLFLRMADSMRFLSARKPS